MIKKISFKFAINTMLIFLALILVYHLLILIELIPYKAVWGGRLKTVSQMQVFETVSISVNLFIILVIAIRGSLIKVKIPSLAIRILLWSFTIMFALNTIGNLFSNNFWEAIIFTPFTFISALLCFRLAIEKNTHNQL